MPQPARPYWPIASPQANLQAVKHFLLLVAPASVALVCACASSSVARVGETSPDADVRDAVIAVSDAHPGDAADRDAAPPDAEPALDAEPADAGVPTTCTAPPTTVAAQELVGLPSSLTQLRVSTDGRTAVGYDTSMLPAVYERASVSVPFGSPTSFLPTNYDWDAGFSVSADGLQVTVVSLSGKQLASFRRPQRGASFVDSGGVPLDAKLNNPVLVAATDKLVSPVLTSSATTAVVRVNQAGGAARGIYLVSLDANASGTGNNPLLSYVLNSVLSTHPNAFLTGLDADEYAAYFSSGNSAFVSFRPDYLQPFGAPVALGSFAGLTPGIDCAVVFGVGALGPSVLRPSK